MAYIEGWGLYAETLGSELGLYDDPYSRFGSLTLQIWRAVRLVVDTGLHSHGWSRQRAIEYFRANTSLGESDIVAEVDRYIALPGQALAYKIGQIRISELRRRAQEQLGPRFDPRAFHTEILAGGSLPLGVLEARVERWIEARKR
jgi:prolyl oligopeptidase